MSAGSGLPGVVWPIPLTESENESPTPTRGTKLSDTEKTAWESIRQHAGPYPPEAFMFMQEGLRHTVEQVAEQRGSPFSIEDERHISGQQLCMGLRDYAIQEFGLLARTVLAHWHIHRTEDFGRIVFALVDAGLMRKTEQDCIEDFSSVFDFEEVFGRQLERC